MSWRVYFEFGHADMVRKENKGSADCSMSLYLVQKSLRGCCYRPSRVQTVLLFVSVCLMNYLYIVYKLFITYCRRDKRNDLSNILIYTLSIFCESVVALLL